MKCPSCNTEMIIVKSGYVIADGKLYRETTRKCRNKNCPQYRKEGATERSELPATTE